MSSYVCEDLMANIFERLPPKSVVKFRTLSKYWCCRLASPDFVRMHTLRSLNNNNTSHQKVLMRHWFYSFEDIFTLHTRDQLQLDTKRGYTGITGVELPYDISCDNNVGSCNGILCLKSFYGWFSLWNFSVRRKVAVPVHPSIRASDVVFGFGYDRIAHDYNIVGISYTSDKGIARNDSSFIYSMKTDSWSMIAPPTSLFSKVRSNACYFNGNLHWVVRANATDSSSFIMTFTLTTRVFGTIELAKLRQDAYQLTIINGSLAVVSRSYDVIMIWLMREYDNVESWLMFFKLKTEDYYHVNVLQPISNGDLLLYDKKGYVIYDHEIKSFTEILKFRPTCMEVEMETYVESLELLDRGIPCGTIIFPWTEMYKLKRSFTSLDYDDDDDDDDDDDEY